MENFISNVVWIGDWIYLGTCNTDEYHVIQVL